MFQSVFGVFTSIFMAIFKFLIIAIAIILVPLLLSMAIFYLEPIHIKIASKIIAKVRFPKYRTSSLS